MGFLESRSNSPPGRRSQPTPDPIVRHAGDPEHRWSPCLLKVPQILEHRDQAAALAIGVRSHFGVHQNEDHPDVSSLKPTSNTPPPTNKGSPRCTGPNYCRSRHVSLRSCPFTNRLRSNLQTFVSPVGLGAGGTDRSFAEFLYEPWFGDDTLLLCRLTCLLEL